MKSTRCDFTLNSASEVSFLISSALEKRAAFSLVRLGDGEGLLLSMSRQSPEPDFEYLARHLGPNGVAPEDILHLKARLLRSIKSADVIGVRDDIIDVTFAPDHFAGSPEEFLKMFRGSFRLREIERTLDYHGSRRIAFLHRCLGELELPEETRFCSAWFHYDYHNNGEIMKVLARQDRIGVISCRERLPGLLEELFDVSVKFVRIPAMFRDIAPGEAGVDYVEQLESVLDQQFVEFPGMLCLVGGGLYGKLYCQMIKSQGGVALDLGSLFDAWLGVPSRPAVYLSKFGSNTGTGVVPPALLLTRDNIELLTNPGSGQT